jgi:hypothetical protein
MYWRDHEWEGDMDKVQFDVNDTVSLLNMSFHALQQWQL